MGAPAAAAAGAALLSANEAASFASARQVAPSNRLRVGLIGCGSGMRTKATADGVGLAATAAVVGGIVAIALADGLLAVICYVWGV